MAEFARVGAPETAGAAVKGRHGGAIWDRPAQLEDMSRCRGRTSPYQDGLTIVGMPPYASGPTAPLPPCCAASEDWLTCPPFGNCHITANSAAPAPASTVSPTAGKPFDTRSSLNAALLEAVAGNDSAAILAALKAGLPANSCVPWRSGSAGVDDDDPTGEYLRNHSERPAR